jgi:phospholipase C
MPVQEAGAPNPLPLPYQPNGVSAIDCGAGQIHITLSNQGTASTHFAIYANAYRTDGPWQYDTAAGATTDAVFTIAPAAAGKYDLSCYGPNGFQRRFAGNIQTGCGQFEVISDFDLGSGAITLDLRNSTDATATFTIIDAYNATSPGSSDVPPNSDVIVSYPVFANNAGWYDLTVTTIADPAFLRRLTGRLENVQPRITATLAGDTIFLTYPAWASTLTLESQPTLTGSNWTPVTDPSTVVGDQIQVTVTSQNITTFYRLR